MAPMRVFRRLLPTLALFVVPALAAQRQWNWGLTGGPRFHSDDRWHRLSNLGPSIQAYAEHRLTGRLAGRADLHVFYYRSEEHTSERQSHSEVVCRLLLANKHDPF